MVTEADVIMAYRLLLGREPENQQVVTGQARNYRDLADLRAGFMTSPEFVANLATPIGSPGQEGTKPLVWPAIPAEVEVGPGVLEQMVKRIEAEWHALGASEPHWSVLSEDRFKSENIAANETAFFDTGELQVMDLRLAAARSGLDLAGFETCFELGCGVGRTTMYLARQFREVTAADISAAHLELARAAANRFGVTNVRFAHLNELRFHHELPSFDVFFSFLVLMHNPPPLMAYLLETMLDKLRPGGIGYFQIPTYIVNYAFSAADYLAAAVTPDEMEVHCLPQTGLFGILARTGCRILEIREDGALGPFAISNRLLVRKSA
jgi:SAM-dependent methyltransferase